MRCVNIRETDTRDPDERLSMRLIIPMARLVMLLLIGVAIVVLWTYCAMILPSAFAHAGLDRSAASVCAGLLTLLVLAAAPALPIQILFPRHAIAAAAAIGWMPLICELLAAFSGGDGVLFDRAFVWKAMMGCAGWMAVVMGAWLVARWRLEDVGVKPV